MKKQQKQQLNRYDGVINSPVGKLGIIIANKRITKVDFVLPKVPLSYPQNLRKRYIIDKIKKYFCDPKIRSSLLIHLKGTSLQQKIWRALRKIPLGETITYGELARKIGTSPRVIGNACCRNPIPIIIPCHCVVAAVSLGGYCGKINKNILKIKKWLLQHEKKHTGEKYIFPGMRST